MKYYPINESLARAAKHSYSMSEYITGSATASYQRMVDEAAALGEQKKTQVPHEYHEEIDRLVDLYARRLADNLNKGYQIETRCPSILISGGGNFPVRKKEKQNAARDKNLQEYNYIQGILDRIKRLGTGGIRSDDKNAVERLQRKLEALQDEQEAMKAVNAYYRKHKTLEGCTAMSERALAAIAEDMKRSWHAEPKPFEAWALSNNSANIRRIKERIETLKKEAERQAAPAAEYDGFKLLENQDAMRIQFLFDGKPSEAVRDILKEYGFRWAPSEKAWQRMLNQNGRYAALCVIEKMKEVEA